METQTIAQPEETCPKDIVQQLLDIAKSHDALDEIGGATSWRWQEGIISRMPKTKTVAKVLRKAYNSDDPYVWYQKTKGSLKTFIHNSILDGKRLVDNYEPKDIYETLFIMLWFSDRGFKFEEMVVNLASLKFLKNNSTEDEFSFKLDNRVALEIYGKWATKKTSTLISFFEIKKAEDGLYKAEIDQHFNSERMFIHKMEIQALRFEVVGATSSVDMYRTRSVGLSDSEMIDLEWMIIDFYKKFNEEVDKIRNRPLEERGEINTRFFSFTTNTFPFIGMGGNI